MTKKPAGHRHATQKLVGGPHDGEESQLDIASGVPDSVGVRCPCCNRVSVYEYAFRGPRGMLFYRFAGILPPDHAARPTK